MSQSNDNRYDHQFEDLAGAPDDADTEIDLGDNEWQAGDDQAADDPGVENQNAAGADDDAPEAGPDDGEPGKNAPEPAAAGDNEDLNGRIDAALDQEAASARDRELETMRAEIAELKAERERESSQAAAGQIDSEIAEASSRMSRAYEEGDTDAAVEAQQQLVDLQVKKQLAGQQRPAGQEQTQGEPASNESGRPPAVPEAGKRWVARNPWFAQGTSPQAAQTALVIERQLREAGYDPESDAMYAEIDKHLARRHPDVAATAPAQTNRRKTRAAPTNGMGAQGQTARSGRVTITAEDKRWMAQTGLDPDNPEHAKTWAREKRAEANRAARR